MPTRIHKGRVKFFHRNQDKETISCTQVAKNECTYLSQGMLELTGDAKAFPETSNDLEVQNKLNGKWKKNKEKKKKKEEERKKWVKDIMIMDLTCVNDKKEVVNSRAEMAENVEEPNIKEKKKKKKKRKKEDRRKRGQELVMGEVKNSINDNRLDGEEAGTCTCNSTAVMAESTEKQKDDEKLREAMLHADIIHQTWIPSEEQLELLKEKGV